MSKNLKYIARICGYSILNISNEREEYKLLDDLNSNICKNILEKYVKHSFLAHWKSTVESLVLQRRENRKFSNVNSDKKKEILYRISIIEKDEIEGPAVYPPYSYQNESYIDIIYINKKLTIEEKRCVIAHELGHLIVQRFLKENEKLKLDWNSINEEELANIFMCYILDNRSEFYKDSKNLSSFIKDITDFKKLRDKIIKRFFSK